MYKLIKLEKRFVQISNDFAQDKDITLDEKGMILMLLSFPEDFNFTVRNISVFANIGIQKANKIVKNLEEKGYIAREKITEKGKIKGVNYYVTSQKELIEDLKEANLNLYNTNVEKPCFENQNLENQNLENHNNNIKEDIIKEDLNKKRNNKKNIQKEIKTSFGEFGNVKLTSEQIEKFESKFPNKKARDTLIKILDEYLEETGKSSKYKNHYLTMTKKDSWVLKKAKDLYNGN